MAMKLSVPSEESVIVKNGNLSPGEDWGKGQALVLSRDDIEVAGVSLDPVDDAVRWWLELLSEDRSRLW
jgi:hypothetical protein